MQRGSRSSIEQPGTRPFLIRENDEGIDWGDPFIITASGDSNAAFQLIGGDTYRVDWGDGSGFEFGTNFSHVYDPVYTGDIRVWSTNAFASVTRFNITQGNLGLALSSLNPWIALDTISFGGLNRVSGELSGLPASMRNVTITGTNTVSGNLVNWSADLLRVYVAGNNTLTGDIANVPVAITQLNIIGSNTLSGSMNSLPATCTDFQVTGSNTITGDGSLPRPDFNTFVLTGLNTTNWNMSNVDSGYWHLGGSATATGDLGDVANDTSIFICNCSNNQVNTYTSKLWNALMGRVTHSPASGFGLSTADVDQLLIDLSTVSWNRNQLISIAGNNSPRSAASDAAVTSLVAAGVTVITN